MVMPKYERRQLPIYICVHEYHACLLEQRDYNPDSK